MDAPRLTKTIGHARSGSRRRVLDGEFDSPPSPPIHFRPPSSAGGLAGTLQCQCATLRARSARQGGSFNTARAQGRPKWHHSVPDPFPGAPALRSWRLRQAPTGCPLNQLLATISVRGTRPPPYGRSKPGFGDRSGTLGPQRGGSRRSPSASRGSLALGSLEVGDALPKLGDLRRLLPPTHDQPPNEPRNRAENANQHDEVQDPDDDPDRGAEQRCVHLNPY
jgi:hypothetical protein